MPCRFGEVVRERRSRPRRAFWGRAWKSRVGVRDVGLDEGGIATGGCKWDAKMVAIEVMNYRNDLNPIIC